MAMRESDECCCCLSVGIEKLLLSPGGRNRHGPRLREDTLGVLPVWLHG